MGEGPCLSKFGTRSRMAPFLLVQVTQPSMALVIVPGIGGCMGHQCQNLRPRRVGDLRSEVGLWGVHFGFGTHIQVLARLRATLWKSNAPSTLCLRPIRW